MNLKQIVAYLAALLLVAALGFAEKEAQAYCDKCGADLHR
jgi:hypothetical protein